MKWIGTQTIYNDVRIRGDVDVEHLVKITNTTTSSASQGGQLNLVSDDGAALGDDHRLGKIGFQAAEDGSNTLFQGASIQAFADAAWSGSENGTRLEFYTADGNGLKELSLTLDSDLLATFAGAVTVTGALTVDSVEVRAIQTSGESFVDDDLSLMTSAAVDDRINTAVTAEDLDLTADSGTAAVDLNSQALAVTGGTGITTSATGQAVTLNVDASQTQITSVGTIGTGVWQGTAVASAYLDADTAHISATKQITSHEFTDNMGTTKQYVGLTEADAENTDTANKYLPFPAIVAGKLLKVALRSNKNLTGHTLTWRLESIGAANPNSATPDILGTQSGAGCNNSTMTTYDFTTGLDSGANAFDASDLVFLSIQSDTAFGANVIYYITCLWEHDFSSVG